MGPFLFVLFSTVYLKVEMIEGTLYVSYLKINCRDITACIFWKLVSLRTVDNFFDRENIFKDK